LPPPLRSASRSAPAIATAQERTEFRVAWSIYVGWMPWGYLEESGIMDRWAERYGIDVEIVQINDYVESINLYTAGEFDGVTATNMDTLSIPAGSGVDTTALIVGDFSNGNDAVILKGEGTLEDLAGMPVNLVELSVSHYLLARALERGARGARPRGRRQHLGRRHDRRLPDRRRAGSRDVEPAGLHDRGGPGGQHPLRQLRHPRRDHRHDGRQHRNAPGQPRFRARPGGGVVRADGRSCPPTRPRGSRRAPPWPRPRAPTLRATRRSSPRRRCSTNPAEAVAFVESEALPETMVSVAEFLFEQGILGEGAPSADFVGVEYPGGVVTGDPNNIRLRFDPTFMQMAADGAL
jgi:NitT/TauT family transport system substrate-binding protein